MTGTGHHPSTCPATNDLANAFFYNQSEAVCIYIAEPKLYLLLYFMKHHIFFYIDYFAMLIEPSEQEVETVYTGGWEINCDSLGPCHLDEVSRGSVIWGIF